MFTSILVAVPLMALLAIGQTVILPRFSPFDANPSLPFLFALAWSLLSNVEEGVVWAFIAGLFMDIFTIAPVGGLSLSYMVAIFAVSFMIDLLPANRVVVPATSAVVATIIQQLLYWIYLSIFGVTVNTTLMALLQTVVMQAVLILPIYWVMLLGQRIMRPKPVQI